MHFRETKLWNAVLKSEYTGAIARVQLKFYMLRVFEIGWHFSFALKFY